jgi:carbon-monoxide dehydrogenase small subunit
MSDLVKIKVKVNGKDYEQAVEPRLLLSDFLRHNLELTATHVGCEHGMCGACTILLDDTSVRSCLVFAVQANGHTVETADGLGSEEALHPLQQAFMEEHALQCGFCTPGLLMSIIPFLRENPKPTDEEIREAIDGNLCRCTGYENIVKAVKKASIKMAGKAS